MHLADQLPLLRARSPEAPSPLPLDNGAPPAPQTSHRCILSTHQGPCVGQRELPMAPRQKTGLRRHTRDTRARSALSSLLCCRPRLTSTLHPAGGTGTSKGGEFHGRG